MLLYQNTCTEVKPKKYFGFFLSTLCFLSYNEERFLKQTLDLQHHFSVFCLELNLSNMFRPKRLDSAVQYFILLVGQKE